MIPSSFTSITTKVTGCNPRIPFRDGFVPPEEDEREGDVTPFSSLELQLDDSHKLPPEHPVVTVLVSPTMSTGGGSMG